MIAVVSVDKFGDACVIVAMDDVFLNDAIAIVRERNKKFPNAHCYVQQNINYVTKQDQRP